MSETVSEAAAGAEQSGDDGDCEPEGTEAVKMAAGGSRTVAVAALRMAMSESREAETLLKNEYAAHGVRAAAADYGGDYLSSIKKLVERAIVAAKREGVIQATHGDEGSVAGAAREALSQIMLKASGLNVGGKISVARQGEHLSVAVFFGVGLLHLDEIAVGLGHRVTAGN